MDETHFEVVAAESAAPNRDGSYVELSLAMKGEPLHLAFPVDQLAPMVALLSQAATRAHSIAGSFPSLVLETIGTEVFRADQDIDIHFRLADGLDLPVGMTVQVACDLRSKLTECLDTIGPIATRPL
jgi:hypothetical protein